MLFFKKTLRLIPVFFLVAFASFAYADTATETLSQLLKNMHSMQADFSQSIVDKKGKSLQKATGHMSLQRPSQFRWEVMQPNHQLIVTNGKRLWIYDPDLEQVTVRTLVKAAGETPAMLLSDKDLSLTKEFAVQPMNNPSSSLKWFILTPKDKGSMISSLKLAFENQEIRQMQLHDHLGHSTLIEFSNIRFNVPLAASLFNFKPPANIDVIDETKR